jgi:prepilin-type N-terminal cleavage/methylation domain-containing protein
MRRANAFTLIELLVVISIIALLIAILLPALGRAQTAARRLNESSDHRQIGTAVISIAGDNDGDLPFGGYATMAFVDKELLEELRERGVPLRRETMTAFGCNSWRPSDWNWYQHDFAGGMKTNFVYWGNRTDNGIMKSGGQTYRTMTTLGDAPQAESRTLISCFSRTGFIFSVLPHTAHTEFSGKITDSSQWRKDEPEMINMTFEDGHTEWVPFEETEEFRGFRYASPDR